MECKNEDHQRGHIDVCGLFLGLCLCFTVWRIFIVRNVAWAALILGLGSIVGGDLNISDTRLTALILVIPTLYLFLTEIRN